MNSFLRDLRYGLRTLARNPGFAAVAVLTIGIGIGASTTIFSWMRSMLLNPLPGATEPERVVAIENTAPDGAPLTTSYLDFRDFRDNLHLVDFVTARVGNVFSVGDAPQTTQVWGEMVSGGEMWMPITMYGQLTHTGTWMLRDRNTRNYMMFARLALGVTIEQARAEVQALANRMAVADADADQGIGATVLPVWQSHFGTQSILLTPITILMGASGVVLLIVCANLANLLLARATGRLKE